MQSVKKLRFKDISASQRTIGIVAVVLTAVIVAAAILVYIRPPSQQLVRFVTNDVASISTGQDVRVAGVSVGKIDSIELGTDSVTVQAKIDENIFIGDRSRVAVRMLTVVGGYYTTLEPQGERPLGTAVIPTQRVSVPYSIADVLQEVPPITDAVRADDLHTSIDQVASGLTDNTESIGSMIKGLDSIASIMDQQRRQVSTTLELAQSYLETFNLNRDYVFALIKKIELVLARYHATWAGFNQTYTLLGEIIVRISPLAWFYLDNKDRLKTAVTTLRDGFQRMQSQMNPLIDQLTAVRAALEKIVGQGGLREALGNVILATDVCVPVAGRSC
jgi:phospholipid/cholesterol/gamma-HCH transport system substrate-binding protein